MANKLVFKAISVQEASRKDFVKDGFMMKTNVLTSRGSVIAVVEKAIVEAQTTKDDLNTPYLFDDLKALGIQEEIFAAFDCQTEAAVDPTPQRQVAGSTERIQIIWSTQLRSVPTNLIRRANPNPWTDGPSETPHIDSHPDRQLHGYVVDSARLEDCWNHSHQFRTLSIRWMATMFPDSSLDKAIILKHLTEDFRRYRVHAGKMQGNTCPGIPEAEITQSDMQVSSFWVRFKTVPCKAVSFWCNLTPGTDVAKPLAFASPTEVVEVEDRSVGGKGCIPPRPGHGGTIWASQTLAGPEYKPATEAMYEAVYTQPFGATTFFDTRLAPHVAAPDKREGVIRISLEARRLTFDIDTSNLAANDLVMRL